MAKRNRPSRKSCTTAARALQRKITKKMEARHGPAMRHIVPDVLDQLWPAILELLRDQLVEVGGLGALGDPDTPNNVKARFLPGGHCATTTEAAVALPGIGRLDIRGLNGRNMSDLDEAKHWMSLRLDTIAIEEFRDVLRDTECPSIQELLA